jgi:hypothetical protein
MRNDVPLDLRMRGTAFEGVSGSCVVIHAELVDLIKEE